MIAGKKITVGITGGIAAYKAAEIVSWLAQQGAEVRVAMTQGATRFIAPLTLRTLSGRPVAVDLFDEEGAYQVPHIELADCDAFIVLPATANILAKMAHGLADDLLSAALLATRARVIVAPAMNINMYEHAATQANLRLLVERGVAVIEPAEGRLACGTVGRGRLPETAVLKAEIMRLLLPEIGLLQGLRVLVTAGPTYEYIDPVRFIGNRSSGKMGYAVAAAARAAGATVTLVSGPTQLVAPPGVEVTRVVSAVEMYEAVWQAYAASDIVIMAAAVADYAPEQVAARKLKKQPTEMLQLVANVDILASLGREKGAKILVGFAAETENLEAYAEQKLRAKNLDLIVANNVLAPGAGFDGDTNVITLLQPGLQGVEAEQLPLMPKTQAAEHIIAAIAHLPRFRSSK